MPDVTDFDAFKDRRVIQEIKDDQARWEWLRRHVADAIASGGISSNTAITSATVNALLGALVDGGDSFDDAKNRVADHLRCMRE